MNHTRYIVKVVDARHICFLPIAPFKVCCKWNAHALMMKYALIMNYALMMNYKKSPHNKRAHSDESIRKVLGRCIKVFWG